MIKKIYSLLIKSSVLYVGYKAYRRLQQNTSGTVATVSSKETRDARENKEKSSVDLPSLKESSFQKHSS